MGFQICAIGISYKQSRSQLILLKIIFKNISNSYCIRKTDYALETGFGEAKFIGQADFRSRSEAYGQKKILNFKFKKQHF